MKLLEAIVGEMTRTQIQALLKLRGRANFEDRYLKPAVGLGLVEMILPGKPRSSKQRYRLSEAGKRMLASISTDPEKAPVAAPRTQNFSDGGTG
jgi:ATP-dependent DNA helicase RecG